MDTLTKTAAWVALGLVFLFGAFALGGTSGASQNAAFGSTNNTGHEEVIPWGFGNGIQIGTPANAPVLKVVALATCNPTIASLPLAATSTATATCTLGKNYNLATTDSVFVSLPANGAAFGALIPTAANVSTGGQAPTISFQYENLTGAATSSFAQATTSVSITAFRLF